MHLPPSKVLTTVTCANSTVRCRLANPSDNSASEGLHPASSVSLAAAATAALALPGRSGCAGLLADVAHVADHGIQPGINERVGGFNATTKLVAIISMAVGALCARVGATTFLGPGEGRFLREAPSVPEGVVIIFVSPRRNVEICRSALTAATCAGLPAIILTAIHHHSTFTVAAPARLAGGLGSCPTLASTWAAAADVAPSAARLVEHSGDDDVGPRRLASARQPPSPRVPALSDALQGLGSRWRRPAARLLKVAGPPVAPGAAAAAKGERSVARHQGDFMPLLTPGPCALVGDMPSTGPCALLGCELLAESPRAAAFAPPHVLAEAPVVLISRPRRLDVRSSTPALQALTLRRGEHGERGAHRAGDEGRPAEVIVQGGLLFSRRLRMESHRLASQ